MQCSDRTPRNISYQNVFSTSELVDLGINLIIIISTRPMVWIARHPAVTSGIIAQKVLIYSVLLAGISVKYSYIYIWVTVWILVPETYKSIDLFGFLFLYNVLHSLRPPPLGP